MVHFLNVENARILIILLFISFTIFYDAAFVPMILSTKFDLHSKPICPRQELFNRSSPTGELALPIEEDCLEAASISWDFIDKIIYINPAHSKDRNTAMMRDFLPVFQKSSNDIIRFEAFAEKEMFHAQRVAMSHVGALQLAIEGRFKNVLVLEDDVVWRVSPDRKNLLLLQELVTRQYDVVLLGGTASRRNSDHRVTFSHAASSYLVRGGYIPIVQENFQQALDLLTQEKEKGKDDFAIDVWWHWLMEEHNWYIVSPALVIQTYHTLGFGYSINGER